MGLDMYLIGKMYVKDWGHNYKDSVIPEVTRAKTCQQAINSKFPVTNVEVELGYWRKANHIHQWFVKNTQGGVDECQETYISIEDLKTLLDVCKQVLVDHSKAEMLLPSKSGFFFGSTDYDEYYYKDIEDTVKIIESCLENDSLKNISVYYQSSW